MGKKSRKNSKGDTWEWEETPEVTEAFRELMMTFVRKRETSSDYGVGK